MPGPFVPAIVPIVARYHYLSRVNKWHVFVSRQVEQDGGARYENTKATFETYAAAVSFVSTYWGNA